MIIIISSYFAPKIFFHIFYLFIHLATLLLIHFPRLSFSPLPFLCTVLLRSLLFGPYLSFSRSLLIYHPPTLPPPLTGVWAFNIQSMPPSSEPSFSTAGFDRQVPPLPLRPYRSQRMREKDAGREKGGGETQYTLRTVVAVQTDRWQRSCSGGEGRPRRAGMDGKASLCWGWRGQADSGLTLGGEGGTEALADSLPAEYIYSS